MIRQSEFAEKFIVRYTQIPRSAREVTWNRSFALPTNTGPARMALRLPTCVWLKAEASDITAAL